MGWRFVSARSAREHLSASWWDQLVRTFLFIMSEQCALGTSIRDEFVLVVRNAPLVAIDLIIRDPDRCVLVGLQTNEPAKGKWFVPGGWSPDSND